MIVKKLLSTLCLLMFFFHHSANANLHLEKKSDIVSKHLWSWKQDTFKLSQDGKVLSFEGLFELNRMSTETGDLLETTSSFWPDIKYRHEFTISSSGLSVVPYYHWSLVGFSNDTFRLSSATTNSLNVDYFEFKNIEAVTFDVSSMVFSEDEKTLFLTEHKDAFQGPETALEVLDLESGKSLAVYSLVPYEFCQARGTDFSNRYLVLECAKRVDMPHFQSRVVVFDLREKSMSELTIDNCSVRFSNDRKKILVSKEAPNSNDFLYSIYDIATGQLDKTIQSSKRGRGHLFAKDKALWIQNRYGGAYIDIESGKEFEMEISANEMEAVSGDGLSFLYFKNLQNGQESSVWTVN
ncbi:MAG: hypothetical protein ABTQ25_06120 [Nitrosomonas ureae]